MSIGTRDTTVIFSDVDGTLIDASGREPRRWASLREALSDCRIVLTSSRTVEELLEVQYALGLTGPVIAENGAILGLTDELLGVSVGTVVRVRHRAVRLVPMGTPAAHLRGIVKGAAAASGVEIEAERGLTTATMHDSGGRSSVAVAALARSHSLLVRVGGAMQHRLRFFATLTAAGLTVSHGGRWHVVQGGSNKGVAIRALTHLLRQETGESVHAVGVGDGENDVTMLEAVDQRIVMRGPDGHVHPALREFADAFVPAAAGVDGWHEIVSWLLPIAGGARR